MWEWPFYLWCRVFHGMKPNPRQTPIYGAHNPHEATWGRCNRCNKIRYLTWSLYWNSPKGEKRNE